jgi:hypothetical protein
MFYQLADGWSAAQLACAQPNLCDNLLLHGALVLHTFVSEMKKATTTGGMKLLEIGTYELKGKLLATSCWPIAKSG